VAVTGRGRFARGTVRSTTMCEQLESILSKLLIPDNDVIKQVTQYRRVRTHFRLLFNIT